MDKERFLQSGLLEQYVLGLTTPEESAEVERYASAFPDIQAEIESLRQAVMNYAEQQVGPFPEEEQAYFELPAQGTLSSSAGATSHKKANRSWQGRHLLLLVILLFFGALSFYYHYQWNSARQELAQLHEDYLDLRANTEAQEQQLVSNRSLLAFFSHPDTRTLILQPTAQHPESKATIFLNEKKAKAFLYVHHLPEITDTQQYRLWGLMNGQLKSLYTLADRQKKQLIPITYVPQIKELFISTQSVANQVLSTKAQMYAATSPANKLQPATDTSAQLGN